MSSRFGAEYPQCGAGDQVALKVEGIMDGGMHAEKALGGSSRFEPLHFALSSSHCLMRILGRDNSSGAPVQARRLAPSTGTPRRATAFGGSK